MNRVNGEISNIHTHTMSVFVCSEFFGVSISCCNRRSGIFPCITITFTLAILLVQVHQCI